MASVSGLVALAQAGDLEAFGRLVGATQTMVHAVAFSVLRDSGLAQDAAQDAYLRAFRRLGDLKEPGGFIPWLRRIAIAVALNTRYPMCEQAWELEVEDAGQWLEVLAWGVFTNEIVAHVGGDPERHTAIGVGNGLERLAMIRYKIDDIRRIDATHAA